MGDALGAAVEFWSLNEIRSKCGPAGVQDFLTAYGRIGAITDDTQMTLFTAEGLLRAENGKTGDELPDYVSAVHHAYLRWLLTQREASQHRDFPRATRLENLGWLYRNRAMRSRRAPGSTCIASLRGERAGTPEKPVNFSKGCGGLMRIAPAGIFFADPEMAFDMGMRIAALTHGHPSGYLAAGTFAAIIRATLDGSSLESACDCAIVLLKRRRQHEECLAALEQALLSVVNGDASADSVEQLGSGWLAEEALAIAVYCAVSAKGDFKKGVLLAVNHGGDSDSTGALTGNILGALCGVQSIPARWLEQLELRETLESIATDLSTKHRSDAEWLERYPS